MKQLIQLDIVYNALLAPMCQSKLLTAELQPLENNEDLSLIHI